MFVWHDAGPQQLDRLLADRLRRRLGVGAGAEGRRVPGDDEGVAAVGEVLVEGDEAGAVCEQK